ncbi:hypothetical protein RFI_11614 [Reticulomyxa filosa]|uniref:Uncharacterized protein n=1 Tax=Reticulomyxa filosa TaxID=46433 RepID=X6NHP3_RETFI|nr:hypothetical protein RFI_11614 [Reticulomyxa filosa]|eukprot:ETO25521.1 hypothetical protein RFI_11614 [Reticulomyxa filosa]
MGSLVLSWSSPKNENAVLMLNIFCMVVTVVLISLSSSTMNLPSSKRRKSDLFIYYYCNTLSSFSSLVHGGIYKYHYQQQMTDFVKNENVDINGMKVLKTLVVTYDNGQYKYQVNGNTLLYALQYCMFYGICIPFISFELTYFMLKQSRQYLSAYFSNKLNFSFLGNIYPQLTTQTFSKAFKSVSKRFVNNTYLLEISFHTLTIAYAFFYHFFKGGKFLWLFQVEIAASIASLYVSKMYSNWGVLTTDRVVVNNLCSVLLLFFNELLIHNHCHFSIFFQTIDLFFYDFCSCFSEFVTLLLHFHNLWLTHQISQMFKLFLYHLLLVCLAVLFVSVIPSVYVSFY